ncbi:winged helix-turn-helix domain-containing protein [Haloarchaeobius sp. FL176]|uniref:ArsR/SmtB family transcription factor n=1 Tax=Haloarchaeobius sp. FL176 TaxID=2967129 RepID=UPI0021475B05|nr:winged helix-turn-helix domain-containing protein [Haloarchaeobius sp. FL176]
MAGEQLRRRRVGESDRTERRDSPHVGGEAAAVATEREFTVHGDDASAVLELLDDDYARQILEVLDDGPLPARPLVERCDASKPTVYRRLNRLEEQDFVAVGTELDRGGHHRKVFDSTLVSATVEFDGGCPAVRVTVDCADDGPTRRLSGPSD